MKDVVKTNVERPNSSKRLRRRRRNMSAYYFLVILLVAGVGLSLSMTFLFNINEIRVLGETKYSAEEIVNASQVYVGDNMVRLKSDEVKDKILSSLVYIENVKIKKAFPDVLEINVEPCVPYANIEHGDGYILVSRSGKMLENNAVPRENLLTVTGLSLVDTIYGNKLNSDDEQKLRIYERICDELEKQEIDRIVSVDLTDKYEIAMNYDNRISVELGDWTDIAYKLAYVKRVLGVEITEDEEGYFIMRGTNGASFISKADMERYQGIVREETNITTQTGSETEWGSGTDTDGETSNNTVN